MVARTVFFLHRQGFEPAWMATSMGVTAAAMGEEVTFVFAFDALRSLVRDQFGKPVSQRETSEAARAKGLGAPTPAKLLAEARTLGARVIACDTTLKLCGFSAADAKGRLDEVMGLAQLWRLTDGAKVLTF